VVKCAELARNAVFGSHPFTVALPTTALTQLYHEPAIHESGEDFAEAALGKAALFVQRFAAPAAACRAMLIDFLLCLAAHDVQCPHLRVS
jgi:hypothetical protein